jgi:hypothetical protein
MIISAMQKMNDELNPLSILLAKMVDVDGVIRSGIIRAITIFGDVSGWTGTAFLAASFFSPEQF